MKISRDWTGEHLSISATRNGAQRGPIMIWSGEVSLLTDSINIIAASERAKVVARLPVDLQDEAQRGLDYLAATVVSALDDAANSASDPGDSPFAKLAPWPDPVAGAAILEAVRSILIRHVVLPEFGADTLALWVAHTYVADVADYTPYIHVKSPVRECGKTTLLELLEHLAFRAQTSDGISAAALFRRIDRWAPTILLDELDAQLRGDRAEDLRGILNSGFKRGRKFTRCVGDDQTDTDFHTYSPKVLAGIGKLWDTVASRAILIAMRRASRAELKGLAKIRGHLIGPECEPYQRRLARWATDNREALRSMEPTVPESLGAREGDIWRPLLAIAEHAGGDWPARAHAAATSLHRGTAEGDYGLLLLSDLRELFASRGAKVLASETIVDELAKRIDRPWPEYNSKTQKPITQRGLASLLGRFDIQPKTVRLDDGKTPKGYRLDEMEPVFRTYLDDGDADLSATSATSANHNNLGVAFSVADRNAEPPQPSRVADVGDSVADDVAVSCAPNYLPRNDVADVADSSGRLLVEDGVIHHRDGSQELAPDVIAERFQAMRSRREVPHV
jgi:hypothetical protein